MRAAPFSTRFARALLSVALVSGLLCGIAAVLVFGSAIVAATPEWLLLPAGVPLLIAVVRGRGVTLGLLAGVLSASVAFVVVAVYALLDVACFILTFMGDC